MTARRFRSQLFKRCLYNGCAMAFDADRFLPIETPLGAGFFMLASFTGTESISAG